LLNSCAKKSCDNQSTGRRMILKSRCDIKLHNRQQLFAAFPLIWVIFA